MSFPSAPGIGRVEEVEADAVRVDFFESAAEPYADSVWRPLVQVRRVLLGEQTRVFFQDGRKRWRAGRVVGGGPDTYYVRVPNVGDVDIDESRLRVRWEKVPHDPLQVLLAGANETPRYRDVREPVRRLLLTERAATASATGIISAGIRMHAHQISAALRIIRDPVQRYLLADEVGMGKTIQAGLVMRQLLVDDGTRRIGIIAPDALLAQWRSELLNKFYLDDFPTRDGGLPFRILGHSEQHLWRQLKGVDLLVVDEAHMLARTSAPSEPRYLELSEVAHAAPRVLMLSATPFSRSATTHLALLHLLDPELFRWEERDTFVDLLAARHQLALAVFGLDEEPDTDNPELLELQFRDIRRLLPDDETLRRAMEQAVTVISGPNDDPRAVDVEALRRAVATVRTHVSETYRLHHRVIRNRRHVVENQRLDDKGLLTPFEFTGRTRPKIVRLESNEATSAATAVAEWVSRCAAAILDDHLDARPYGRALGILSSRLGGPAEDLHSVLEYRVNQVETRALLPAERAILDEAPVLPFEAHILDELDREVHDDGTHELAAAIAKRCKPVQRVVVFCGRGVLASNLADHLAGRSEVKHAHAHVASQAEAQREAAITNWRSSGGILVVDDSGDVGRNFQDADAAFHVRLPWNPNSLEQRIGRVDRYGGHRPAQQFVIADADPDGVITAWARVLSSGFGIFNESISTLQEAVDDLAEDLWSAVLTEGIEGFADRQASIVDVLRKEKRRINELDALEASYGTHTDGEAMAMAIASYEEDPKEIEEAFSHLIGGAEGFRFASKTNMDGSITFERGIHDDPLLSARLLGRLNTVAESRTGYFDRWQLRPRRRIFRRGNPFIDGLETLLSLDDRGQAVALWRLDKHGPAEPMTYFGFDFLIEADLDPILKLLDGRSGIAPIARRRADAALAPQHQRVWIPANTLVPVDDSGLARFLSLPYLAGRDVNLNLQRIAALHSLLGGEEHLAPVAEGCFAVARRHVEVVSDVVQASAKAAEQVRRETEIVLAQSQARSKAAGLVTDPAALEAEVEMGRAIEAGVAVPVIRVSGVSCVVVAANSWAAYV